MKKFLSLILVSMLLLCSTGVTIAIASTSGTATQAEATATEQNSLYLVPGTYMSNGSKVENSIASGARKLTQEQCDAIYTENAYLCELSKGSALPTPTSERVDAKGNKYAFNGWWTIVDATVTYFDKVPAVTQTTFFYADWRADLSQRRDPIEPSGTPTITSTHYMTIKRAATGEIETFALRVSGTDMSSAETLGYGSPVQLYNEWFELNKDDVITVYTNGLGSDKTAVKGAPILDSEGHNVINLEASGDLSNITANSLSYKGITSNRHTPTLT